MKTRTLLILMVLAAFLATSCDQGLFGTNFFSGLDGYKAPDYANATSADLVKASEDDRFYDEMSDAEKIEVLGTLQATYDDPTASDEEKAEAVLLKADVHIYTTGADQTLTALNTIIGDAIEGTAPSFEDETFISSFFAEDATVEEVAAQLEALAAAADALSLYGGLLAGSTDDETLIAQDDNALDTATVALIGGLTEVFLLTNDSATLAAAIVSGDFNSVNSPATATGETATDQLASMNFDANLIEVINAGLNLDNLGF